MPASDYSASGCRSCMVRARQLLSHVSSLQNCSNSENPGRRRISRRTAPADTRLSFPPSATAFNSGKSPSASTAELRESMSAAVKAIATQSAQLLLQSNKASALRLALLYACWIWAAQRLPPDCLSGFACLLGYGFE